MSNPAVEPALEIRGLRSGYGDIEVRRGIDLTIAPGTIVALVGSNGAGKTTLLRVILGVQPSTRGTVTVASDGRRRSVGYVPQRFLLDPDMPLMLEHLPNDDEYRVAAAYVRGVAEREGIVFR